MNDELFAELMASIEEAGQIARGEVAAARTFTVEREPLDVKRIREGYNLSQTRFAACRWASASRPCATGSRAGAHLPAPRAAPLQVAARHPDAVWDVVRDAAAAGA